jgi:hypothetical protein
MRRRQFITLIGSAAVWPLAARAEQGKQVRRVGVLMNLTADDLEASARVTVLGQGLQQLGWTLGRNMQMDYRWGAAADADRSRSVGHQFRARPTAGSTCGDMVCRKARGFRYSDSLYRWFRAVYSLRPIYAPFQPPSVDRWELSEPIS